MKNNNTLKLSFSPKLIILLCLLTLGSTLWAQTGTSDGYVFYSGGTSGEYLANDINGTSTFNPSSCIWRGTSGDNFTNGTNNLRMSDGSYLISTTNTRNCTLVGTESGTTGMTIYGNSRYLRYYNGVWTRTNDNDDENIHVVFAVTKYDYPLLSVAPTVNTIRTTYSFVGESGTYTHTDAQYRVAYLDYVFYNGAHHYCLNNTSNATTSAPAAEIFTYTWSWETAPAAGHVTLDATTGEVTYDNYFDTDTELRLKLTAQSANMTFTAYSQTLLFEDEPIDPASVSVTDITIYMGTPQTASVTLAPNPCYRNLEFISSNTAIATVNNAGLVSGVAIGSTTITVKAYKLNNTDFLTTTFNVTVKDKVKTPVISIEPNTSDNCATATATITCPTDGATIHYTTDGTTPNTSSNTYSTSFSVNNGSTVKALAVKNVTGWDNSDLATLTYARPVVPTPTIEINNGSVTFTCTEPGVTFHYTTNGDTPTASSTSWTGPTAITGLTNECTIKVIATKPCWDNSTATSRQYIMASGIASNVVTLNDYEDHNWTYYSDPKSPIKSLYPRNVKITYYGNGKVYKAAEGTETSIADNSTAVVTAENVAVSRYETANTFVYYKTLERDANNSFPYTLIPNPFSKRPTYNSDATTKWRGFYKWRVKSVTGGGIYEASTGGSALGVGSLLDAEKEYYFRPTDNTATNANNATSMTVELEAVWARAYRVTATTNDANTQIASADLKGGSYERNFVVISSYATNRNTNIVNTNSKPVTITMIEPDGSADYRSATVYINPTYIMAQNDWRFEWINIQNNSSTISANGHNLVLGRGILRSGVSHNAGNGVYGTAETDLTASYVNGLGNGTSAGQTNYTSSLDFKLRIESGAYSSIGYLAVKKGRYGKTTSTIHVNGVYGNDYDRAIGNNDRLISKGGSSDPPAVCLSFDEGAGIDNTNHNNYNKETLFLTIKSGYIGQGQTASSSWAPGNNGLYMGGSFGTNPRTCGNRRLLMEGGKVISITGGMDRTATNSTDKTDNNVETLIMRFKGTAEILTSAFGGAAENPTYGNRHLIFTGGMVHGWVATGCNGIAKARGQNYGIGYMYVGGNAKVGDGTLGNINGTGRGIVMGAGNGRSDSETTGEMTFGSNVVIADNADIESHVFGGGNYGYVGTQNASNSDAVANIYIAGGTVHGNVYGGSNQKHGEHVKITMVDGLVEGGIYGGSNVNGDIRGNVELHINGGQIGTSTESANVHGGGLGNATRVLGNVSVAVGKQNTDNTVEGDAVIYGDVYGGSAQGKTNGNTALTAGKTTQVTINAGTIYGSVYGGGLGNATYAADVYGPVTVTVNGGKVCSTSSGALGAVFGCNNANGRPQGKVNVDVTGGEMEYIYGGGNAAPYTVPTPNSFNNFHVKMSGGTVNKHVFGGGLGSNAIITGNTEVLISGSATVKGNVYGGGNAGTVTGDTNVRIGEN